MAGDRGCVRTIALYCLIYLKSPEVMRLLVTDCLRGALAFRTFPKEVPEILKS